MNSLKETRTIRIVKHSPDRISHVLMKDSVRSQQLSSFSEGVMALFGEGVIIQPLLDPGLLLSLTEENAIHAASIKALTADTVGRGWKLRAGLGEASEAVRAEIQRIENILSSITPRMSLTGLLGQLVWELIAVGYAGWEVVRDPKGDIGAIYPIPPQTLFVQSENVNIPGARRFLQSVGNKIVHFKEFGSPEILDAKTGRVFEEGEQLPEDFIPASEVIFFSQYSPRSPIYGLPHWIAAIPAMAELAAIREYNIGWFESGGTADRVIHVKAKDPKEAESVASMIEEGLESARGFGHVSIITAGSEDVDVDIKFLSDKEGRREGQFLQRREDLVKEVLMAHQMPPYRVGWAELGPVSSDTEVLTASGWKRIPEVKLKEAVFTLNLATDKLELQSVEQLHKYYFTRMISMVGDGLDILVSHCHRMWMLDWKEGIWGWWTAGELYNHVQENPDSSFLLRTGAECSDTCAPPIRKVAREVTRNIRQKSIKEYSEVPYNDFAHCLTVKNGTLIYRRNGGVFIAGNSLGGSAAREMLRAYRMGAVEPLQAIVEDQINNTLFNPKKGGIQIAFDIKWTLESVDWELVDQNLDIAIRSVQNGLLSPATAAALLGFSPPDDPALKEHYLEGVQITSLDGKPAQTESSRASNPEPKVRGNQ